jgi:hypothetical protein
MRQVVLQLGFSSSSPAVPCGKTTQDSFSKEQDQGFNRAPTLSLSLSETSTPEEV